MDLASRISLVPGVDMPRLGLGTYKSSPSEVVDAVEYALSLGYRSVDTASLYGNEEGIGEALARSGVARSDLFITTKVWNDEQGYGETRSALGRSLERLGLDHVDLYLVHWPVKARMFDTWRAMESLLEEGSVRAIGVCNHLPEHLDMLLSRANVPPAIDQVEFHPWLQQPDLQAYLAEREIVLEAWAPIMKGRVGEVPEIASIADAHGVSPAQVAIRWILQSGHVTIPKSVHRERIAQNADVFRFELTVLEMETMASLDRGLRFGSHPSDYAWE